jgi:XapX domain-containing protein
VLSLSFQIQIERKIEMIKIVIRLVVGYLIGVSCRYFDIPVPSPPVLPDALLVVAMTLGYTSTDRLLSRKDRVATTKHHCGGPSGQPRKLMARGAGQILRC